MAKKYRFVKSPLSVDDANQKKRAKGNDRLQGIVDAIEKRSETRLEKVEVGGKLEDNFKIISQTFKYCSDFVLRRFTLGKEGISCFAAYIDDLVNKEQLNDSLLKPLMSDVRLTDPDMPVDIKKLIALMTGTSIYSSDIEETGLFKDTVKKILLGCCALFIDGSTTALIINVIESKGRQVTTAQIEPVVRGPKEAFVEDFKVNISLLRQRLKTPDFKLEKLEIGRLSSTSVVISYIDGIVDKNTVDEIRKRLKRIDIDMVIDSGYIEKFIEDDPYSPFPQMMVTERPDKSVAALAEGRIVILTDASPTALVLPVTFPDFLNAAEDSYTMFYFSSFIRIVRYIAFAIALLGPSLYIAITTFHQEMIPLPLLITIARSRADVPFPAIVEALLMEFTFDLFREAGIRLPLPVGPAVSIVGGLVIGQGAVQAGIVSQAMVIVVSITGIASFAIPAFNTATSVRLLRYPMMILAAFLGVYGIIMGLLALLIHLVALRSAGVPYLSPFTPLSLKDMKDTVIKFPLWAMHKRPSFIQKNNLTRMKPDLKPGPENES